MGVGGEVWVSYSSCVTGVMLHSSINYQQEHVLPPKQPKLQNYGKPTCDAVKCAFSGCFQSVNIEHLHHA
jgi:hypothetical protein